MLSYIAEGLYCGIFFSHCILLGFYFIVSWGFTLSYLVGVLFCPIFLGVLYCRILLGFKLYLSFSFVARFTRESSVIQMMYRRRKCREGTSLVPRPVTRHLQQTPSCWSGGCARTLRTCSTSVRCSRRKKAHTSQLLNHKISSLEPLPLTSGKRKSVSWPLRTSQTYSRGSVLRYNKLEPGPQNPRLSPSSQLTAPQLSLE